MKFEYLRKAAGDRKYLICNADEGDPGAYMNRNELESDPHSLLEGMAIGGYVTGATARDHLCPRRVSAGGAPAERRHRAGQGLRPAGREHPGLRLQLRHRAGRGRRRLCLRRGDRADQFAGRTLRPFAAAPALSRAERACGAIPTNINNVETWFNIPPIIAKGPAWFTEHRQRGQPRHQGLLAGRQGDEHRPGGNAARHPAQPVRLRCGRRQHARPQRQGGADRRTVRRLHSAQHARYAGRLRSAGEARLDHGLGRHGGDGRRQLHGRRRPLFHRVHPRRILRAMHALPRRSRQGAAHAHAHHQRRGPRGGPGRTRRTGPDDPRHVAVRARPVRAELGADRAAPFPPRVRGPHPRQALPRRRLQGSRRWRLARTVARCT